MADIYDEYHTRGWTDADNGRTLDSCPSGWSPLAWIAYNNGVDDWCMARDFRGDTLRAA